MHTAHAKAAEAHIAAALAWEAVAASTSKEVAAVKATRRAYALSAHPDADTGGDFDNIRVARLDAKDGGPLSRAVQHRFEAEDHEQNELN